MQTRSANLVIAVALAISFPVAAHAVNIDLLRQQINKGNYLMRTYHFQEAINEYQEALKTDPGNVIAKANIAEAHNNWGIYYFGQHKYKEAYAEWQKCLELSPGHANARRNLAVLKRVAQQQGIDLTADTGSGASGGGGELPGATGGTMGGAPVERSAATGAAAPSATGAAAGSAGGAMAGATMERQEQPVEAPTSETGVFGAVKIISPALKQSMEQQAGAAAQTQPTPAINGSFNPAPSNSSAPALFSPAPKPQNQVSGEVMQPVRRQTKVNPLFPVLPPQFVGDDQPSAQGTAPPAVQNSARYSAAGVAVPPAPAGIAAGTGSSTLPASSAVPSAPASSLEDQLSAIEMKVYGQKQPELTVLQRLEKIEKDTAGATRAGTIIERIDYLKKSFGI